MKVLIRNATPACLYSSFGSLIFGLDGTAFSNLEANNFIKLCYSIDDSVVFPPGYVCSFNLHMQDFVSFSVLILESENIAVYRLQVSLKSTSDHGRNK